MALSLHGLIVLQAAVAALNTLQTNFSVIDAIRKSGKKTNEQAIPEMVEWCQRIGYKVRILRVRAP
jgi:hypothetical protein